MWDVSGRGYRGYSPNVGDVAVFCLEQFQLCAHLCTMESLPSCEINQCTCFALNHNLLL